MKKHKREELEKLASPEQLDRLLKIVRIPGWIALVFLTLIIIGILLWSIFGRLPLTSTGIGIFFNPWDVELIQSESEGVVDKIYVKMEEQVKANDLILRIQPVNTQFKEVKEGLSKRKEKLLLENQMNMISLKQNQSIYELQNQRLKELTSTSDNKDEIYQLQLELKKQEELLAFLESSIAEKNLQLDSLNKQEEELKTKLNGIIVRAPSDGTILAVNVLLGEVVSLGKNLAWLQKKDKTSDIYGFFSIKKGELIKPGMKAHIMFDSVNAEIYGKMEGIVKEILPYASSPTGEILHSIPAPTLQAYLTQKQASIAVVIEPQSDHNTISGFKWTTPSGPPFKIPKGSLGQVEVFLEETRPITYLFPIGSS